MIVSRKNVRCENTQVLREAIAEEEEEEEEEDDDDDDDDFLLTTADHYLLQCTVAEQAWTKLRIAFLLIKGRISYICVCCCRIDLYDTI